MKKIGIFLLCLCAMPVAAEVSVLAVTDEDKHTRKEDFYHTFEYAVRAENGREDMKCQATRVTSNWFVTAAHCVKELCQKNCTIRMDLLEGPVSVWVQATHTTRKPAVFVHPKYKLKGKQRQIQNDLALIYLNINQAPKIYYRRVEKPNRMAFMISEKSFLAWLEKHRSAKNRYQHALYPSLPPIAVFDDMNQLLDRKISVISIFDGVRRVKPDPHAVYYVKDLGYAYTNNFGVRKGMSGSGVMTNTGELIGIISSTIGADAYMPKKGKVKHEDFFMFPVFNANLINFMKDVMGKDFDKISQKDAYPYLAKKTYKDFSGIVSLMNSPNFNWH